MALSYTAMATAAATESFILRVEATLLQDLNNGTTRMEATPPVATDTTAAAQSDRLARQILADPHAWAVKFARLIAVQLIGKTDLINEGVTTDGDLLAAVGVLWPRFLPSL